MLQIDISAPEPIYEQIIAQVGFAIIDGDIRGGDKIPPIRQLAKDLEINPNTVAKAYQILEDAKIIKTQGRSGSIILDNASEAFIDWVQSIVEEEISNTWRRLCSLSPNLKTSHKVWKRALGGLQNEK